jgi:hypothetical protein
VRQVLAERIPPRGAPLGSLPQWWEVEELARQKFAG